VIDPDTDADTDADTNKAAMTAGFLILSTYLLRALAVESAMQSSQMLRAKAPRLQDTEAIVTMRLMDELPDIPGVDPELLKDPAFRRLMAEGLAIQDRFAAEPIYARTGKGYLKSAGVSEIKAVKEKLKAASESILVREDP